MPARNLWERTIHCGNNHSIYIAHALKTTQRSQPRIYHAKSVLYIICQAQSFHVGEVHYFVFRTFITKERWPINWLKKLENLCKDSSLYHRLKWAHLTVNTEWFVFWRKRSTWQRLVDFPVIPLGECEADMTRHSFRDNNEKNKTGSHKVYNDPQPSKGSCGAYANIFKIMISKQA